MVRRIRSCSSCRRRYASASGTSLCPICRQHSNQVSDQNDTQVTSSPRKTRIDASPNNNESAERSSKASAIGENKEEIITVAACHSPSVTCTADKAIPIYTYQAKEGMSSCVSGDMDGVTTSKEQDITKEISSTDDKSLKMGRLKSDTSITPPSLAPSTMSSLLSNVSVIDNGDMDEAASSSSCVVCVYTQEYSDGDVDGSNGRDTKRLKHSNGNAPNKKTVHRETALKIGKKCSDTIQKDVNVSSAPNNITSASMPDPNYECFICGSSLARISTGIRGRLSHLKRCAKKHGIAAGEMRLGENEEDFIDGGVDSGRCENFGQDSGTAGNDTGHEDQNLPKGGCLKLGDRRVSNPYSRDEWHEGANIDLALAQPAPEGKMLGQTEPAVSENANSNWSELPTEQKKVQSSINSFFRAPVKSLNNVLLAGARRLAKSAELSISKNKPPETRNVTRGRFQKRRRQNFTKGSCPNYKRIPGTDFICDGFVYACDTLSSKYFLTHFHSDHYGGITSSWSAGIIYCSLPTANLLHQQLGVQKRFLHPLGMMTPTVIESRGKPVTVTLLDANHCPGSVMFLFEIGPRKILHVGDFRWDRAVMLKQPPLQSFASLRSRLDEIFLDTTYCNEKYTLPTQAEAISGAIEIAEKELVEARKRGSKTLFLFGSYSIGKERIYLSVAERLRMKVYVDPRRYRMLSALNWPSERMKLLTMDRAETPIWVVPLGHINFKNMKNYVDESTNGKVFTKNYDRLVGFRPTGWSYTAGGDKLISCRTSGKFSIYGVPYSEHSSFPELVDCLVCLKPKKITPTVSVSKSAEQVDLLLSAVRKKGEKA